MFDSCSSLKSINLSFLENNTNFENAYRMFYNCSNLDEIEFPNVYIEEMIDLSEMFFGCINIKKIELEKFQAHYIYYMNRMFYDCKNLKYLDITGFSLRGVIEYDDIFKNVRKHLDIEYIAFNIEENIQNQIKEII